MTTISLHAKADYKLVNMIKQIILSQKMWPTFLTMPLQVCLFNNVSNPLTDSVCVCV